MRINKYLAHENICSRREADRLIESGKVFINGSPAHLGDQVEEGDQVEVKNYHKEYRHYAYYKPRGIITHSPQGDEKDIAQVTNLPEGVFPLGRLDKDSHGLILLTNDGRITKQLLTPESHTEKEYVVEFHKPVTQRMIQAFINGVELDDGYTTKPCSAKKLDDYTLRLILTEGKNRQIRRMAETLGYQVLDLMRVRVGHVSLEDLDLRPGDIKRIKSIL